MSTRRAQAHAPEPPAPKPPACSQRNASKTPPKHGALRLLAPARVEPRLEALLRGGKEGEAARGAARHDGDLGHRVVLGHQSTHQRVAGLRGRVEWVGGCGGGWVGAVWCGWVGGCVARSAWRVGPPSRGGGGGARWPLPHPTTPPAPAPTHSSYVRAPPPHPSLNPHLVVCHQAALLLRDDSTLLLGARHDALQRVGNLILGDLLRGGGVRRRWWLWGVGGGKECAGLGGRGRPELGRGSREGSPPPHTHTPRAHRPCTHTHSPHTHNTRTHAP